MRKAGLWALIIIVLFLALCGGLGFVLQIPFFLVVGWILYLLRVVPQVTLSPSGVVIGLLALLASTALCHTVVSWLWNHSHPTQPWRPRWTITCYFLVLLTFAAGICIVSITHQIYWIISSPKPFVDSDFHASDDAKASSIATVLQTMGSELPRYRDDHRGKFPTLRQLSDWSVMVGRTDSDGNVTPAGKLGPYIFGPPHNPFTRSSSVVAENAASMSAGWVYDETTGAFRVILPEENAERAARYLREVDFVVVP